MGEGASRRGNSDMPLPLHVREYGDTGQPVVLLHGLFGSSANWGSIARELGERYRVIVPDLRNHGQSPHTDEMDYPAMAGDLWALCDRLHVERPLLIGHSMGGKVVMQAALTQPGRPAGIAAVDIAPVAYAHDFSRILDGIEAIDLATLPDRKQADRDLKAYVPEPGVRAFLLQNLVRTDGGWGWRVNLPVLRSAMRTITGFDVPPDGHFEGPAYFIHGALSHYVQPGYEPVIRALFPRAALCKVQDAGHWVYAEQRDGFMRCLRRFLQAAAV